MTKHLKKYTPDSVVKTVLFGRCAVQVRKYKECSGCINKLCGNYEGFIEIVTLLTPLLMQLLGTDSAIRELDREFLCLVYSGHGLKGLFYQSKKCQVTSLGRLEPAIDL